MPDFLLFFVLRLLAKSYTKELFWLKEIYKLFKEKPREVN